MQNTIYYAKEILFQQKQKLQSHFFNSGSPELMKINWGTSIIEESRVF